jgi:predicted ArsR family transcriptional regulator
MAPVGEMGGRRREVVDEVCDVMDACGADDRIVTALREANGAGMTKAEIAAHLELSERAIDNHIKTLATAGAIRHETGARGRKTWFVKDDEIDRYIELVGPEAEDV